MLFKQFTNGNGKIQNDTASPKVAEREIKKLNGCVPNVQTTFKDHPLVHVH